MHLKCRTIGQSRTSHSFQKSSRGSKPVNCWSTWIRILFFPSSTFSTRRISIGSLNAEDVQLFATGQSLTSVEIALRILRVVDSVRAWISSNQLRLNPDKTQFIWLGTSQQQSKRDVPRYPRSSNPLSQLSTLRLDPELTFRVHITIVEPIMLFPTASSPLSSFFSHSRCSPHTRSLLCMQSAGLL